MTELKGLEVREVMGGRVRVTGKRGGSWNEGGGRAAGRAARRDKEEIIQSISPGHGAIIRSHLFSRAILPFIELLCLQQGDCMWGTLTHEMPRAPAPDLTGLSRLMVEGSDLPTLARPDVVLSVCTNRFVDAPEKLYCICSFK